MVFSTPSPLSQAQRPAIVPSPDSAPDIMLARGRTHEACGPARHSFAMWLAQAVQRGGPHQADIGQQPPPLGHGPVLWIGLRAPTLALNASGMAPWVQPGAFVFVQAEKPDLALWAMEEGLRSGAVPLVVADLPSPPGLPPVRRLHLAAEAAGTAPLGLLLCPDIGGAAGIETRWHMAPAHEGSTAPRWRLERLRARALPPKAWVMQGMGAPAQLQPVSDHTAIGARPT